MSSNADGSLVAGYAPSRRTTDESPVGSGSSMHPPMSLLGPPTSASSVSTSETLLIRRHARPATGGSAGIMGTSVSLSPSSSSSTDGNARVIFIAKESGEDDDEWEERGMEPRKSAPSSWKNSADICCCCGRCCGPKHCCRRAFTWDNSYRGCMMCGVWGIWLVAAIVLSFMIPILIDLQAIMSRGRHIVDRASDMTDEFETTKKQSIYDSLATAQALVGSVPKEQIVDITTNVGSVMQRVAGSNITDITINLQKVLHNGNDVFEQMIDQGGLQVKASAAMLVPLVRPSSHAYETGIPAPSPPAPTVTMDSTNEPSNAASVSLLAKTSAASASAPSDPTNANQQRQQQPSDPDRNAANTHNKNGVHLKEWTNARPRGHQ